MRKLLVGCLLTAPIALFSQTATVHTQRANALVKETLDRFENRKDFDDAQRGFSTIIARFTHTNL